MKNKSKTFTNCFNVTRILHITTVVRDIYLNETLRTDESSLSLVLQVCNNLNKNYYREVRFSKLTDYGRRHN